MAGYPFCNVGKCPPGGRENTHTHTHTHIHTDTLPSANRKKHVLLYFPGGTVVKNLFVNAGDAGDAVSVPGWEDPLE